MERKYKGYVIVKQYVGPCGWNIVRDGVCVKTGCRTIAEAKEWITWQVDFADAA